MAKAKVKKNKKVNTVNELEYKPYLNRKMQESVYYLLIMETELKDIVDYMKDIPKYKPLMRWLRTSLTLFGKVIELCFSMMPYGEKVNFEKYTNRFGYRILPKNKPAKDEVIINAKTVVELTEAVKWSYCTGCTVKDYKCCDIRKALLDAGISTSNDTEVEKCRYNVELDDENAYFPVYEPNSDNTKYGR